MFFSVTDQNAFSECKLVSSQLKLALVQVQVFKSDYFAVVNKVNITMKCLQEHFVRTARNL